MIKADEMTIGEYNSLMMDDAYKMLQRVLYDADMNLHLASDHAKKAETKAIAARNKVEEAERIVTKIYEQLRLDV